MLTLLSSSSLLSPPSSLSSLSLSSLINAFPFVPFTVGPSLTSWPLFISPLIFTLFTGFIGLSVSSCSAGDSIIGSCINVCPAGVASDWFKDSSDCVIGSLSLKLLCVAFPFLSIPTIWLSFLSSLDGIYGMRQKEKQIINV